jgi:hypothetical protein
VTAMTVALSLAASLTVLRQLWRFAVLLLATERHRSILIVLRSCLVQPQVA